MMVRNANRRERYRGRSLRFLLTSTLSNNYIIWNTVMNFGLYYVLTCINSKKNVERVEFVEIKFFICPLEFRNYRALTYRNSSMKWLTKLFFPMKYFLLHYSPRQLSNRRALPHYQSHAVVFDREEESNFSFSHKPPWVVKTRHQFVLAVLLCRVCRKQEL